MIRYFIYFLMIFCSISKYALSLDIKVTHKKLDNGMEVYVIPNHRTPAIMHMVLYKTGGSDDPAGYSGLSHFFEHLMFSGTEKFPNPLTVFNNIGAQFNALTSQFCTIYYELIPKEHLPIVMDIESDRMQNLKITDKAFTREQNVVLEERKMRVESTPKDILQEEMENAFYYNGYGRPVIGWEHEINKYNKEIAETFYKDHYSPNNAILIVAGDADPDQVMFLAKQYYGKIEANNQELIRVPKLEPQHKTNMTLTLEDSSVEIPELFLMHQVPSGIINKNYMLNLMAATLLGQGQSSMLYNDLVIKNPIVTSITTNYNYLSYSDNFLLIHATPKDGVSLQTVEEEIYRCINSYIENGIPQEYLDNMKNKIKADFIYALDGLDLISNFYGINLILGVPLSEINNISDMIDNIDIQDINLTIKNIFKNNVKFAGHLLPKSN
ncbi:insulinase family protein [Ehrlichia sp. JZT12]